MIKIATISKYYSFSKYTLVFVHGLLLSVPLLFIYLLGLGNCAWLAPISASIVYIRNGVRYLCMVGSYQCLYCLHT